MSQSATRENTEENASFGESAAQGAAVGAENAAIDPHLQAIVERWPDLSEPVKAGIVALVRAAGGAD